MLFSKSRILFLVPRDTETPVGDYNIYFHNEATGGDNKNSKDYSKLDHVWLWNDRTDFGVSLPLTDCFVTKDGTIYNKSLQINYETFYEACNDFKGTKQSRFIMTHQTAPTGIVFKTEDGTNFAPKDDNSKSIEYLALPLPPNNSKFDIYINAAKDGKFTIRTDQDVDLTKNKNIVFYSASGLDHLWMWSKSEKKLDEKLDVGFHPIMFIILRFLVAIRLFLVSHTIMVKSLISTKIGKDLLFLQRNSLLDLLLIK